MLVKYRSALYLSVAVFLGASAAMALQGEPASAGGSPGAANVEHYIVVAMTLGSLAAGLFTGLAALFPNVKAFGTIASALGKLPVLDAHGLTLGRAAKTAAKAGAVALFIGAGSMTTTGCTLFQSVARNPAVYVADFEIAAAAANDGAKVLFPIVKARLSPDKQASAQAAFDKAESAYAAAVTLLNDGVAAYQAGTKQSWGPLVADVQNALGTIIALVDTFASPTVGAAQGAQALGAEYTTARAQLSTQWQTVNRYHL